MPEIEVAGESSQIAFSLQVKTDKVFLTVFKTKIKLNYI